MIALLVILVVLTLFYSLVIIWISAGTGRLSRKRSTLHPFVSVIVAARNEEENIGPLLEALTKQNYPADMYEIIIVNDGSTDDTASIVHQAKNKYSGHKILLLNTTNRELVISPKKNAITRGIEASSGEIIMLTDADCLPPAGWLRGITHYFTPDVGMVIGFSPYELPALNNLSSRLLALDSLSLAAVAAGTCGWGAPATCNGRNLAYRKCVFNEVGGFAKINHFASGDDDLFLKLVLKETMWKIRYALNAGLAVPTKVVSNVNQFVNQRVRHASKGLHYERVKILLLALVYLFNLLMIISPIFMLYGTNIPFYCFLIKFCVDFYILFGFALIMKRMNFMLVYPLAAVIHLYYIVIFGALGQFKKFKWKENEVVH